MNMPKRRRRDAGHLQLTERDQLVLTWIAEQYCISYDQLRRLLALYTSAETKNAQQVAYSTAMNAVQRWLQMGLIDEPRKIIHGHSTYVWLSRKGIKELDLPYAYYQPKASTVKHFYAVNAIRLSLQQYAISAIWKPQRLLHIEHTPTPLSDAELQALKVPLLAIVVVEKPINSAFIVEKSKLLIMLLKQYERVWCFSHHEALAPLYHVISALTPQECERVVFFNLEAKEVDIHDILPSTP